MKSGMHYVYNIEIKETDDKQNRKINF